MILMDIFDLNFKGANGEAVIHKAIIYDQSEIVECLIKKGVHVNQIDEKNGNTLFHLVVLHSKSQALSILLNHSREREYNRKKIWLIF